MLNCVPCLCEGQSTPDGLQLLQCWPCWRELQCSDTSFLPCEGGHTACSSQAGVTGLPVLSWLWGGGQHWLFSCDCHPTTQWAG